MKKELSPSCLRPWSTLLFVAGFFIGILFLAGATWADYEALLFDPANGADGHLKSMRCPTVISPYEKGTVSATIRNDTDRERTRRVQAHISAGYVSYMKEYLETVVLAPGEARIMKWEFEPQDAAWDLFVLARVTLFRNPPQPSLTGSCGVMVINILGLPGKAVSFLACSLSLTLMAAGIGWRKLFGRESFLKKRQTSFKIIFASLIAFGMTAVFLETWALQALVLLAVAIIGLVVVANFALGAQRFSPD